MLSESDERTVLWHSQEVWAASLFVSRTGAALPMHKGKCRKGQNQGLRWSLADGVGCPTTPSLRVGFYKPVFKTFRAK